MKKFFETNASPPAHVPSRVAAARPDQVAAALARAAEATPPLWPLHAQVAVNPFMGLSELSFAEAARVVGRVAGARVTMPRHFYVEALREGTIELRDLEEAAAHASPQLESLDGLDLAQLASAPTPAARPEALATVAELATSLTDVDWGALVVERIATWAEGYYDRGQASWSAPGRGLGPFAAWRAEAIHDRLPELRGLRGFRSRVGALPSDAGAAAHAAAQQLELSADELPTYAHRLAMTIGGWAGFVRQRGWHARSAQEKTAELVELLTTRLVWDALLLQAIDTPELRPAWATHRGQLARAPRLDREAEIDLLLHRAYEHAAQRRLVARFPASPRSRPDLRPRVQAAFCIDVRSERLRRALERQSSGIETLGVAGFFGVAMELRRLGDDHGVPHCPALVTPSFTVDERVSDPGQPPLDHGARRRRRDQRSEAWGWFKRAAVSSFAYVELAGLGYGLKLLTDSLGWTRPVADPNVAGLTRGEVERLRPDPRPRSTPPEGGARPVGIDLDARIELSASLLGAMSLRSGFARIVLLCGHGATTVNNPHGHGLQCGACGGQSGAANARVAAQLLGDPAVRRGLEARGIVIPADTVFVPALHDTVTDQLHLLDVERIPAEHARDLDDLRRWIAAASEVVRAERAPSLGERRDPGLRRRLLARSRDWAQVRPEWGLAGCTGFIIGPRRHTAGADLDGRVFLHSYDWSDDEDFAVLEAIMTAPMVVASWINLQYFASTVDNEAFGCGTKVLHNVVGQLGVAEGNDGDLRPGLPLQSLHDGRRWVHDPARLSVVIAAPVPAIERVLARHPHVRALADNDWLHLFAMNDHGAIHARYGGPGQWLDTHAPAAA